MKDRTIAVQPATSSPLRIPAVLITAMFIYTLAPPAFSYVGPGAGLGLLAALLAIVVAMLATIAGLVLWPLRKLSQLRNRRAAEREAAKTDGSSQ